MTRTSATTTPTPESERITPAAADTSSSPPPAARRPLPVWWVALVLTMLAAIPRVFTLNDFFTVDESFHWVWRVMHFMDALEDHRWANTNLTGHPGVTTLWLGSLGRMIAFAVGLKGPEWGRGGAEYLALLRLPLALVNSLAVGMGYLLLRRLVRQQMAVLAGVLWAWSPFLIAHSRLLHLDGLLTSFVMLSVLCLLAAVWGGGRLLSPSPPAPSPIKGEGEMTIPFSPRWGKGQGMGAARRGAFSRETQRDAEHWATRADDVQCGSGQVSWLLLAASGAVGGLALLTKAPSLLLLPLSGMLLLLLGAAPSLPKRGIQAVARFAVWLIVALIIAYIGWPAMWQVPQQAIGHVMEEIFANGAQPHASGNYFMGQPVGDPGPLFYPAVVLWRSSPVVLVGLLLLPLALWRGQHQRERWSLLALLGFVLLFGVALGMLPKKFDRYLLPIFPALQVLAAGGLTWAGEWATQRWGAIRRLPDASKVLPLVVAVMVLLPLNLWYHPYYLAYFNPLLGGGRTGQYVMLVGWGEGMEQVGAWLRTRPDLTRSPVVSWDQRTLEPFVPVRVVELSERNLAQPASYAVVYSRGAQRDAGSAYLQEVRQNPPLFTLQMYGVDYAAVYQPVHPYTVPVDALFGDGIHLRGYSQHVVNSTLTITPSWNIQTQQGVPLFSFVHVLSAQGERVAQVDVPIDAGLFAEWEPGQQFGDPLPIPLPADLQHGEYTVGMGVYLPQDWSRLPLRRGEALPASVDGGEVLLLARLYVDEDGVRVEPVLSPYVLQ